MKQKIQDYDICQQLDETKDSLIYRAQKLGDKKTVIIKELKSSIPTSKDIARFKQEYDIIGKIDMPGVIKTHDILEYNGSIALVLEDFHGESLEKTLGEIELDHKLFFEIGIVLADTLGFLHANKIIHKDIKPLNILFNKKTNEVKITDFGIASEITGDSSEIDRPVVLEGTLPYISPEQTGRMNRQPDYRTDLYSLGVTFYRMLTGSLPFTSDDPLEIIHHHLAVKETPPNELNPSIPTVVSKMVCKLLSKMPEERYQNAYGLMSDLKKCLSQLEENGVIDDFQLGARDISPFFVIPQILVGRKKELDTIATTVDRVTSLGERSELLLISGSPGIGKSALIGEIQTSIAKQNGYLLSGKYEQFRRDVPYSAFIQAFEDLVAQILAEGGDRVRKWKDSLTEALGPNGGLLTNIIPDLELIIGKQPEIPMLSSEQNQNRFNYTFGRFVSTIATQEHPVVIFLDDLQWSDMASLKLINGILTDEDISYLLIVGSYRDNEPNHLLSLTMALDKLNNAGVKYNTIRLEALDVSNVNEMISYTLKCDKAAAYPLASLVHQKTNGNPFFVNQFLKALYDEDLLELDPSLGWRWDMNQIERLQITDNVVELLAQKITQLPRRTQEIMNMCACVGNRFDLEIIATISNRSIEETYKDISFALDEGMIVSHGDKYGFPHDRVQEAAYSLVMDDEKGKLHHRIGHLVLNNTTEEELPDQILFVVDQLNAGKDNVASKSERYDLARLNLEAGLKAKTSFAYDSAFKYLSNSIALLVQADSKSAEPQTKSLSCWEEQYELSLDAYSNAAESAYLVGLYDEMERLSDVIVTNAKTLLDKVSVYETKFLAYYAQNRHDRSVNHGMEVFKQFGVKFPRKPNKLHVVLGLIKTKLLLGKRDARTLLELPKLEDPIKKGLINLLLKQLASAYLFQPERFPLIIFKCMEISIKHGISTDAVFIILATYGTILCSIEYIDDGYEFGLLGEASVDRLDARDQVVPVTYATNALIRHWKEHIKESVEPMRKGIQLGLEYGELKFTGHLSNMLISYQLYRGCNLMELEQESDKIISILERINQQTDSHLVNIVRQNVQNLLDNSQERCRIQGDIYDEDKMIPIHLETNDWASVAMVYWCGFTLCYLFGEYEMALENLEKFEEYAEAYVFFYIITTHYFYDSLSRLAVYPDRDRVQQRKIMRRVKRNQRKLKKRMRHCRENYTNKYYLVEAERMRVLDRRSEAVAFYNKSIECAQKYEFIHEEGIANECAAKFWIDNNEERYAGSHLRSAFTCYSKWGAVAKVKQIEERYESLLAWRKTGVDDAMDQTSTDVFSATTYTRKSTYTERLDLSTILKASQAISGEIVLARLLERIMKIAMENAGAQKGYFIVKNEDDRNLYVEAEGVVGGEIKALESIPLDRTNRLAKSVVQYVRERKKNIVLGKAAEEGSFVKDPYIVKTRPKSILCGPIMHKGKLSGILYLENNLTTNAFTPDRLELLRLISSQAAISIENTRLVTHREDAAKWKKEMEIAATIQTGLLPKNMRMKTYDVCAHMEPADDVGGDYYDVIHVRGRDWLVIGDVSGHGVTAGLIMMMVQTSIHTVLNQNPELSPSEVLTLVNRVLRENLSRMNDNRYVTMTVFAVHQDGEVHFSGFHQDIMIYRAHLDRVETVEAKGTWIGIIDDVKGVLTEGSFHMSSGDTMLLFTDGITEAVRKVPDDRGEMAMFGYEKLLALLFKYGKKSLEEIRNGILNELKEYERDDDISLVLMRRKNE